MTALALIIGTLTGIISGMGVGGGSLLVLYLTAFCGMDPHKAGGINLFYFALCAPAALIGHIKEKRVVWQAVLWCVIAGGITAAVCGWFVPTASPWVKRLFGLLLIGVGLAELKAGEKAGGK